MIETPQVIETTDRFYAGLRLLVPSAEIRHHMGPGIQEVYGALAERGVKPAGPWFTHHFRRPAENFDFEICVPVVEALEATGRVEGRVWPAMRVARTVYSGDYSGLAGAWGEFEAWVAAQGLTGAEDLWEVYAVNPDSAKSPEDWRTELNRPLL